MAINGYPTLSVADTLTTINELSTTYGWGITAVMDSTNIAIKDSDGHTVMKLFFSESSGNGIFCYYNNGSNHIGQNNRYHGSPVCDIYSTSHGFIIVSHASEAWWSAFLNVNDDGKIICGTMTDASEAEYRVKYLSVCSYGDSSAMALGFTPHLSPTVTTLCNMTGVGTIDKPSVAQYAFYSPVYQTAATGTVDIDGEQYVTIGYWYMKD